MDARTLKALKGSIKKWEAIVAGTGEDHGNENCPLCQEFFAQECQGCPVASDTGETHCGGTPYWEWEEAIEEQDGAFSLAPKKASDDETVMCAVLELEYLKSLLPSKKNG